METSCQDSISSIIKDGEHWKTYSSGLEKVDMETPKAHSIVLIIAKHVFGDEVRQKSMIVMFMISALRISSTKRYKGDYMVNGQALSADAIAWTRRK